MQNPETPAGQKKKNRRATIYVHIPNFSLAANVLSIWKLKKLDVRDSPDGLLTERLLEQRSNSIR